MDNSFDHPVFSKNSVEFITVAVEYCRIVEGLSSEKHAKIQETMVRLLPLLYIKASVLPALEPMSDEEPDQVVTEEIYNEVKDLLAKSLESADVEVVVPETASRNGETNIADLSETLADIYQDIKNCITLYRSGKVQVMNDSLWECRLNFEQYWGQVLLAAMPVLHRQLFMPDSPEKKSEGKKERDKSSWIFSQRKKEWGYE